MKIISNTINNIITSPKTKRASDVTLALTALALTWPLRKYIEHKIRKEDGIDPFFTQDRVGQDGKIFKIWKYQTMEPNPEAENDPDMDSKRVTKLGAYLRAKKLDEIPQFWNVLYGDISMVGPRPRKPEEMASIEEEKRKKILSVPQGVFGPYQTRQVFAPELIQFEKVVDVEVEFSESPQSISRGFKHIAAGTLGAVLYKTKDHKPIPIADKHKPKSDNPPRP